MISILYNYPGASAQLCMAGKQLSVYLEVMRKEFKVCIKQGYMEQVIHIPLIIIHVYHIIIHVMPIDFPPPQQFFPSNRIPKVLITEYYWYFYNICYMPSGIPEVNLLWGAQSFVMTHCFPPQITNPIWNPVYVSMCLLRYQEYKPLWNSYLWISFSISWYLTCYCSIFLHCGLQLNREWEHVMSWVWQQEDSDYWKMMDACMGQE